MFERKQKKIKKTRKKKIQTNLKGYPYFFSFLFFYKKRKEINQSMDKIKNLHIFAPVF